MLKNYHKKELLLRLSIIMVIMLFTTCANSQKVADAVDFNHKRGLYSRSFRLKLSSKTQGSTIQYTLDGSKPSPTNGQNYSKPISIKSNTMVRAYTFADNIENSKIKTHSYIFPKKVIRQKNTMLEDYGCDYSKERTGKVFWTEEMDPEIVDAKEYKREIIQALKDIPTLSVVMQKEDLWSDSGIHWGNNLEKRSDDFERECSIEMIYPKGYKGNKFKSWQENAGIKIQGGGSRWKKGISDHKQSFTLVFKKKFGAGKLRNEIFEDAPHGNETVSGKYDKIVLRAGHNKDWAKTSDKSTVYTRDQLGRDLQILMSGFGSHGTFVHLYLNGKYWGLYNPCERPDNHYLANHLGGKSEDYFYAKGKNNKASNDREEEAGKSKSRFYEATTKDYSKMSFAEMHNWVMVNESIACFLVYGYANPGDSPQYYYGNCNKPKEPVVWTPWDIEDSFEGGSRRTGPPDVENMLDSKKKNDNGFKAFWTNIDFRMRFNDLVYKHFFNDGVMTDESVIAAWDNLTNYIHKAIICESARWGDEKSSNPLDRNNEWDAARLTVRNDLMGNADDFISKLREEGYFSSLPAPKYIHANTEVTTSVLKTKTKRTLTISKDGLKGVVYYTTDGSDPRTWDLTGSVSESAITFSDTDTTINISEGTTIKARTKKGNEWSPLHEILISRFYSNLRN